MYGLHVFLLKLFKLNCSSLFCRLYHTTGRCQACVHFCSGLYAFIQTSPEDSSQQTNGRSAVRRALHSIGRFTQCGQISKVTLPAKEKLLMPFHLLHEDRPEDDWPRLSLLLYLPCGHNKVKTYCPS